MGPSSFVTEVGSRGTLKAATAAPSLALCLLLRGLIPSFIFLLPLLVWPGLARPFSTPKLFAWCGGSLLLLAALGLTGRLRKLGTQTTTLALLSALVTCAGVSAGSGATADLQALALILAAVGWLVVLMSVDGDPRCWAWSLAASAGGIAVLALLQAAGLDVFQAAGWAGVGGTSSRMRVYATLGNPNFVGAFLAGTLPITLALALESTRRSWLVAAGLLQGLAIAASGSRAAVLGACFACSLFFFLNAQRKRWLRAAILVGAVTVAVVLAGLSPARPIEEALQGRLYVWRVSLPQLSSVPVFGHGPGAFESQFDAWQLLYLASPQSAADARFAAPFDHAHNDLLEWTVEYGWAGLAALLASVTGFGISAWRAARASRLLGGAFAGMLALGLISMADFPFHRPAELFLATTLMAMALGRPPGAGDETGDV